MNCFYEDGLNFECQQCSDCCRIEPGYVYLSQNDLDKLCAIKKSSQSDFIKNYCRKIPYFDDSYVLCLKEKENYDCIMWENGGCSVYEARPVQCRTYPFWSRLLSSKTMWKEESRSCPGINKGCHWTKAEIMKKLSDYENNEPLRFVDGGSENAEGVK